MGASYGGQEQGMGLSLLQGILLQEKPALLPARQIISHLLKALVLSPWRGTNLSWLQPLQDQDGSNPLCARDHQGGPSPEKRRANNSLETVKLK